MKKTDKMEHELKILPEYFEALRSSRKKFELRRNDRGFSVGDILILREWNGKDYSGRCVRCHVDYMLENCDGLDPRYVIMSVSLCQ